MPLRYLHHYAGLARESAAMRQRPWRRSTLLAGITLVAIGILIGWSARGLFMAS